MQNCVFMECIANWLAFPFHDTILRTCLHCQNVLYRTDQFLVNHIELSKAVPINPPPMCFLLDVIFWMNERLFRHNIRLYTCFMEVITNVTISVIHQLMILELLFLIFSYSLTNFHTEYELLYHNIFFTLLQVNSFE